MTQRGAGGQGDASIYGLGSWAGARPVTWIRLGAAVVGAGYAITLAFHYASGVETIGHKGTEILTAVTSALAVALAARRPALAAALVIGGMSADLFVSTVLIEHSQYTSAILLPIVVFGSGLFFGARAAIGATVAAVLLYPTTLVLSGRFGARLEALPPPEVARLLIVELSVIGTGVLTHLVARMLVRVHAEAEELRRLEIRLQHMQRLHVVGQLAGVAAHDFRNVLGIFQNAASLLSGSSDPGARMIGADLLQTARSGQAITKQLLSLARREEPTRVALDVADAVERLRPLVTRLLGPRCSLALEVNGPATAVADQGEIEQILLNLAANARDAMGGAGRVRVRVRPLARAEAQRLGSRLETARQVLLEVRDHGTGIAPELHDRIFEPFVTTKARGEGTGLGLATVRSIADASGGAVALESRPGAGATFRVFLPEARAAAEASAPGA